ncbi:MAG: hypothetical protein K2O12_00185, partial [Muribaculaceae bacterium]|nr:hypothetical protein [Muribaculaceae bacterium]
ISAIPIEKKRANAAYFCDEIVKLFQRIEDNQSDIRYVAIQMKFLKYGRLLRYMTSEQKIHFINRLMVCTQVSTVAHSVHVAALADIIIDGVMKYKPSLLPRDVDPGEGGWRRFMHEAALYHDFGKNSIISVITNEYRPSTSHERELIRKHPQTGVAMLGIDSALVKYHDTTLGHHRWYDGSGGYPACFDNTSSPVRIIIDILTIADCLEAATDQFGRNYSPVKRFENAILEFGAQRGSRYNPEILDIIENQEDVYQALKRVVDNDWHKIYYDIYEMYIEE